MFQTLQSWLDERGAHRGRLGGGLLIAGLLAIGLHALQRSKFGQEFDQEFVQTLEFRLRSALGFGPKLDPRLKLYIGDEDTRTLLNQLHDSATQARLLIADEYARALAEGKSGDALSVPLVFLTEKSVEPLDLGIPLWKRERWMASELEPAWLPVTAETVYAPSSLVQKNFPSLGHSHADASGKIPLFIRPAPAVLIPHASLLLADRVRITAQGVAINGERMSSQTTTVLVNYLEPHSIHKASLRWNEVRLAADAIVVISADDSSDQLISPFGPVSRAHLMVAMANSVLTGQWIQTIEPSLPKIFLGCVLGVLAGLLLEPLIFAWALALGTLGISGLGLALFVLTAIKIDWLGPGLGLMLMSLGCFVWKKLRVST